MKNSVNKYGGAGVQQQLIQCSLNQSCFQNKQTFQNVIEELCGIC